MGSLRWNPPIPWKCRRMDLLVDGEGIKVLENLAKILKSFLEATIIIIIIIIIVSWDKCATASAVIPTSNLLFTVFTAWHVPLQGTTFKCSSVKVVSLQFVSKVFQLSTLLESHFKKLHCTKVASEIQATTDCSLPAALQRLVEAW